MGYNTYYQLDYDRQRLDVTAAIDGDLYFTSYGNGHLQEVVDGRASACKWYEHEEDVARLSSGFPNVLFILTGQGEGAGDMWKKYFLSGKVHRAKAIIAYEPFDEKKLEEPRE